MAQPRNPEHRWQWFTDKVLPQLFVALVMAVSGGMWLTYTTVNTMVSKLENQQKDIDLLKHRMTNIESTLVTKTELLETLKRVEQQLEIMMLRAGVRPVKVTEYLAECRRGTEPWKMEHRMLRHKALIQCSRVAFGFSGIVDDEEAVSLRDVTPPPAAVIPATVEKPKKATRPAKEEALEEAPRAQTPREELDWLIRESGLTWEQVGPAAEAGGIFLDASIPLIDQPEDVVIDILQNLGALTAMVKGGAK
jgi:hypothetical protein